MKMQQPHSNISTTWQRDQPVLCQSRLVSQTDLWQTLRIAQTLGTRRPRIKN